MVYMFFAEGFEEIEALATVDILRRCGIYVKTVSITDQKTVIGTHNIPVVTDCLFSEISTDANAYILPGGMPGTDNLQNFRPLNTLLTEEYKSNKIIAAICAAPKILGALGLLNNKSAVCFPGFETELKGAHVSDETVVTDTNIITAKGAGVSHTFAYAIACALGEQNKAEKVLQGMFYN